jgi:biopolymer transport protein ExbD
MSEISNQNSKGKHTGSNLKRKKSAIHIDMTPMVDLAFLLLTFFMLADVFNNSHKVMEITMPKEPEKIEQMPPVNIDNVLTLYPQPGNKMFYVIGRDKTVQSTDMANGELKVLFLAHASNNKFWTIIKPDDHSKYEQMVTIFDLLKQTKMPHYCLENRGQDDKDQLAQL